MANFKNIFTLLFLSLFTVSLWGNLPCNKPECQAQNDCECTNPPNGPSGPGGPGGPAGPGGNGGSPGLPPSIAGGPGNGNSSSPGSGPAGLGSISVKINFGVPANENIDVLSHFSLYVQRPTPMMFSPQMLQYRNYLLDRFSQILVNRNYASQILGTTVAEQSSSVSEEEGGFGRITITNSLPSNVTHQVTPVLTIFKMA